MKLRIALVCVALTFPALAAENSFPGLKGVLSAAEWDRAGLDKLTPDQIGVIDAALIRYHRRALEAATPAISPALAAAIEAETRKKEQTRFGLDKLEESWRDVQPLVNKVVGWQGPNRFLLDNGMVWESLEPIRFEIVDKEVTISARPNNTYNLTLDGKGAGPRVRRVK